MSEGGVIQIVTLVLSAFGPPFMMWVKARMEKKVDATTKAIVETKDAIDHLHTEINSKMSALHAKTGEAAGLAGEIKGRDHATAMVNEINTAATNAVSALKAAADEAAAKLLQTAELAAAVLEKKKEQST